jgi:hypothetical protein
MTDDDRDLSLSQWYTPPRLAKRVVDWALQDCTRRLSILEPSAGRGALLAPIPKQHSICAVEIDPRNVKHLRVAYPHVHVIEGDFFESYYHLPHVIDLCISNPPYENNNDLNFVERIIVNGDVQRGVFLLRGVFLNGVDRWIGALRLVEIERLVFLVNRPKFGGSGSPRSEYIIVDMVRRSTPLKRGEVCNPTVEWWRI